MLGSDNEDTNRIVYNILKNIVVVFMGSIMEGWIGFGLYYFLFFYLIFK
jgi:formate/nitrite transporter FocA (FNT family)